MVRAKTIITKLDTNGDRKLTKQEFIQGLITIFFCCKKINLKYFDFDFLDVKMMKLLEDFLLHINKSFIQYSYYKLHHQNFFYTFFCLKF